MKCGGYGFPLFPLREYFFKERVFQRQYRNGTVRREKRIAWDQSQ